ncbi:MAG: hypothetical protein LBH53_00050 [Puniceicoccales bacterium]|jgi:DNA polymerase-1|nr:hypothetical protein [Puniceicoccales bacterium]
MARVLLVDGHNLAFRSYYGIGELNRRDGFPTGAIFGYASTIWRLEDTIRPEYGAVFFDLGRSAQRVDLLPEYKAHRKPMPEQLRLQLPHVRRLAGLMASTVIERQGVEADDLLASQAIVEAARGNSVAIASSDKDFAQIVSQNITLWRPPAVGSPSFRWSPMGPAEVSKKFSVSPHQIVDYLSLVGDAADNVPGIPRIGAKTAARLLQFYGSVEGIFAHRGELTTTIAKNLHTFADELERNRRLIAFDLSLSPGPLERRPIDCQALVDFLCEFELDSLIRKAVKRYSLRQSSLFPSEA